MKIILRSTLALALAAMFAHAAIAQEAVIRKNLAERLPDFPKIDEVNKTAIPGLYAAGNVMGSPMGMTYGGAGGTLAPGMVFGFLAGRHAAARRAGNSARETAATLR